MRVELVTPQQWKRHHGLLGADKDAARAVASRMFPGASLARTRDVGRADALLIAAYGASRCAPSFAKVFGQWPGDETEEELLEALR